MIYLKKRFPRSKSLKLLVAVFVLILSNTVVAQHFQTVWSNNPYNPMAFVIDSANLDGAYLQIDDEIAVFDVDGSGNEYCVGVVVMDGEFLPSGFYNLTAGADDPSTPDVLEGFVNGHTIIYRYWDNSAGEEFVLIDPVYHPGFSNVYLQQGTALVGLVGYTALQWTGASDNDWSNTANWHIARTPDTSTNVVIPVGLSNYPTLTVAGSCKNLLLQSDNTGDASLLGDALLTVDGVVSVERYVSGGKWHDISAPVGGQTAHSLFLNNTPKVWLKSYNEPTNLRTNITQLSTTLPSGSGFEVWVETGFNATFAFDGPLQTTDLILDAVSTPPLSFSGPEPYGYNLIGNPFASALDWDTGTWNLTDVNATVWVWDPVAGNFKDRAGGAGSLTDGIIPLGQGFFIQTISAAASISIPMNARVHSSQAYYKNATIETENPSHLSIKVVNGETNDEVNIVFSADATTGYDNGHDARKMFAWIGSAPQLYSIQADEVLSINRLPLLTGEGRTVQLQFEAGIDGEQLLIAKCDFLPDTEALLEDLFTGEIQNLVMHPEYTFQSLIGDEPDRFLLHFSPITIGTEDEEITEGLQVYYYNDAVYIKSSGKLADKEKQVFIYDLMGRTILQTSVSPSVLSRVPVQHAEGFVVVKTQTESITNTTKVLVQ